MWYLKRHQVEHTDNDRRRRGVRQSFDRNPFGSKRCHRRERRVSIERHASEQGQRGVVQHILPAKFLVCHAEHQYALNEHDHLPQTASDDSEQDCQETTPDFAQIEVLHAYKKVVDEVNKISHKVFGEEKDLIGRVYE